MLDLVFSSRCVSCDNPTSNGARAELCRSCLNAISRIASPHCTRCLQPFESKETTDHTCGLCLQSRDFGQLYSYGTYDGKLAEMIKQLKFGKKFRLVPVLAALMQDPTPLPPPTVQFDCLVPVPLHRRALARRGFNQAILLAKQLSKHWQIRCDRRGLIKSRPTPLQTELSRNERSENLKEAFATTRSFHGESCLIIDDVFTTGATAEACAAVLKKAGALHVDVLTVARTV